jgi:hypothetical protein
MDALRAEHSVDCSTATLSTVLFTDGEPTQLVIGVFRGRRRTCPPARTTFTTPLI